MRRHLPTIGDRVFDSGSQCYGIVTRVHDGRIEMRFDAPGYCPVWGKEDGIEFDCLWRFAADVRVVERGQ